MLALRLFPSVSLDKGDIICPFASFNTNVKMLSSHSKCKPCGVMQFEVSRDDVFQEKPIQSRCKPAEPKA